MDTTLLLEHLDWVRALAHRLVRDQNVADDLVQEAWLAAERSAPVRPEAARGWFASVLRRKVSERHRLERNRRDREAQVARREAVPSDADLLGKVETETLLVQTVTELDEPFRRTILLRYFEGLTPTEIAASEGVSVSAVKQRLSKGRETLRRRLDEQHGGDGRQWILSLIPVAQTHAVKAKSVWGLAPILAIAAVVAAAVVGGVAIFQGEAAKRVTPTDVERVAAVDAEDDEVALVVPDDGARTGVPDRAPLAAPGHERNETLTIRIVDDATGEPVPGGSAWVIDMDQMNDPGFTTVWSTRDIDDACRRFGQRVIADAEGRADVAWSGLGAVIICMSASWLGEAEADHQSESEVELRVVRSWPLDVRVVDASGEPVPGVRVGVTDAEWRSPAPGEVTDAEGLATIDFFGGLVAREAQRPSPRQLELVGMFPGAENVPGVPILLDESGRAAESPVVLRLPEFGEMRLVAPEDLAAPRLVALGTPIDPGAFDDFDAMPPMLPPALVEFAEGSDAIVSCALGRKFIAVWTVDGQPSQMTFDGPRVAGEPFEVRLVADPTPRVAPGGRMRARESESEARRPIRARLVDEDGAPLGGVRFRITVRTEGSSNGTRLISGRDGEFEFQVGRSDVGADVQISTTDRKRGAYAALEVTRDQIQTLDSVGDIVLRPYDLLTSGTVVDAEGRAVSGASVAVEFEIERRPFRDGEPSLSWRSMYEVGGRTARGGAFSIHAAPLESFTSRAVPPTGRLRLRATKGELLSPWVVAAPGEPVEIALVRASEIELTLAEFDPDVLEDVSGVLVTEGSENIHLSARDGATHTWRQVLPGRYDVEVRHKQFQEPLHVISGIEVTASGCDDPRLRSFDLGAVVTTNTVEVIGHDGRPAEGVTVWVHRADGSSGASGHGTNAEGKVKVVSLPGAPRRIHVGDFGRYEEAALLLEDRTIELTKPLTVRVRLDLGRPLDADGVSLSVGARSADDHSRRSTGPTGTPDADGWMTIELKETGKYEFDWYLVLHGGQFRTNLQGVEPAANVDVTKDGQRIEIAVPEAVLEAVEKDPRVRR